jgi:hypothetical protein
VRQKEHQSLRKRQTDLAAVFRYQSLPESDFTVWWNERMAKIDATSNIVWFQEIATYGLDRLPSCIPENVQFALRSYAAYKRRKAEEDEQDQKRVQQELLHGPQRGHDDRQDSVMRRLSEAVSFKRRRTVTSTTTIEGEVEEEPDFGDWGRRQDA